MAEDALLDGLGLPSVFWGFGGRQGYVPGQGPPTKWGAVEDLVLTSPRGCRAKILITYVSLYLCVCVSTCVFPYLINFQQVLLDLSLLAFSLILRLYLFTFIFYFVHPSDYKTYQFIFVFNSLSTYLIHLFILLI